jgi:hypothetical protein
MGRGMAGTFPVRSPTASAPRCGFRLAEASARLEHLWHAVGASDKVLKSFTAVFMNSESIYLNSLDFKSGN